MSFSIKFQSNVLGLSEFVNMEYNGYHIVENFVVTNLNDYIVQLSNFSSSDHGRFNYKGFTIKKDGKRYNYINTTPI